MKRRGWMAALAVAVGSMGALPPVMAAPAPKAPAEPAATVSVTGTGSVSRAPDMARISLSVTAEGKTAAAAVAGMSKDLTHVLSRLKAQGIAAHDMQTAALNLSPQWAQRKPGQSGPAQINGFVASTRVTVTVRNLDRLGLVLDEVVKAGANGFAGLSFALSNPGPVRDAARKAAVQDAIHKAGILAAAAGLTLGPLRSMSDSAGSARPAPLVMRATAMGSAVPIAKGVLRTQASVHMVFTLSK